jgi:hypothetical protein
MPSYKKTTNKLCKWLYKYIDRYSWGYYNEIVNEVQRANSDEFISKGHHWQKITKTSIEYHLECDLNETVYYTTSAKSDTALLCIDIDAHDEETNAADVAAWIKSNYFPQSHYEPSTRGLGRHLYLLVSVTRIENGKRYYIKRDLFNAYIKDFADKLKFVVNDEFLAELEDTAKVCGVYGTITYKDKVTDERCCGNLAKVPRPRTMEDVENLVAMPVYDLKDLREVVYEALERQNKEPKGTRYVGWEDIGADNPETPKTTRTKPRRSNQECLSDKLDHWNPNNRVFNAVCELTRMLGREPEVEEAHKFYCDLGLNTGEDVEGRRERRIEIAIEKVWRKYNPDISSKRYDISTYSKGEYIEALTSNLSDDDLRSTRYMRRITFDDLDLFLSAIMAGVSNFNVGDEDMLCSIGVEYVKIAFSDARKKKLLKSKANDQKVSAMRELCVKARLLYVDETWVRDGQLYLDGGARTEPCKSKNRGMRYYLTSLNPKYADFLTVQQRHQEALSSKRNISIGSDVTRPHQFDSDRFRPLPMTNSRVGASEPTRISPMV